GGGLKGDDAAFVITPLSDGTYRLRVISVTADGYMTAPLRPSDSNKKVFIPKDGKIIVNPDIDFSGTLASAAASPQLSLKDQVGALRIAAAAGHDATSVAQ